MDCGYFVGLSEGNQAQTWWMCLIVSMQTCMTACLEIYLAMLKQSSASVPIGLVYYLVQSISSDGISMSFV